MDRCWHQDPAQRPSFGEVAQTLETMAFECPAETKELATTRSKVAAGLDKLGCRLDEGLASRLTWNKHAKGATYCAADLRSTSHCPDERLLLDAARAHIATAGASNAAWATGRLRRATAVTSQTAGVGFSAYLVNLSRRAHTSEGWGGAGPCQAQWGEAQFKRYGPHDELVQDEGTREWRRRVSKRFEAQPARADELCRWARVVTAFHACRSEEVALAICGGGFAALATLDPGFFGQGLYFSVDLPYAAGLYGRKMRDEHGRVTVLVCDVAVRAPPRYRRV